MSSQVATVFAQVLWGDRAGTEAPAARELSSPELGGSAEEAAAPSGSLLTLVRASLSLVLGTCGHSKP